MQTPTTADFGPDGPMLVPRHPTGDAFLQPLLATVGDPASVPAADNSGPADSIATLFVFMLATFVGLDVIRRVSRLLHTPLMSLTNAISAIAVVGAILIAGRAHGPEWNWINLLGLIAIVASVTNIVSGFLITDRMLKMFKKREAKKP